MERSNPEKAVIIGAGLSGLSVAYQLVRRGISPLLLDQGVSVGDTWRSRHPQLSLNTHRSVSHMPGFTYPDKTPAFPRRDDVVRHLGDFARKHEFRVRNGVEVVSVAQDGVFSVQTMEETVFARNVIVATGRDRRPVEPAIDGFDTFSGQKNHSSAFGDATAYAGKRVLVIGGGNSGFDIVNHLARVPGTRIWLSVRSGSAILPKRFNGLAVHRFSPLMDIFPAVLSDLAINLIQKMAFGNVSELGLPRETRGAATRLRNEQIAIPVDDGAIRSIKEGKTLVVSPVSRIDGKYVKLRDGTLIEPDIIISATGYSAGLESLLGGLGVVDAVGNAVRRGNGSGSSIPGLFFAGMTPGLVSYFHNAGKEGRDIARVISAR
nr:NAD(P)/FAD-dependent oxidoreductase [Rhizobium sp. 2MFCol3.1]